MNDQVTLVACYYKQLDRAPYFFPGVADNSEHIARVIIVSDGPIDDKEKATLLTEGSDCGVPITILEHPKYPHGVGPSLDQGIKAADTEYCQLMSFDQVLLPSGVEKMLAHADPTHLVIGHVDSIDEDTPIKSIRYARVTRTDRSTAQAQILRNFNRPWAYARNGHTLVHRGNYLALGGFDYGFARGGYGLEDWEYSARHILKFGLTSIRLSTARSYHFSSAAPTTEERQAKMPAVRNRMLLVKTLAKLYNNRWHLFARGYTGDGFAVFVADSSDDKGAGDVHFCCEVPTPNWLPFESAAMISTDLDQVADKGVHLMVLLSRCAEDGVVEIRNKPDFKFLTEISAKNNWIIDVNGDRVEVSRG